jgi:hypothetical protein
MPSRHAVIEPEPRSAPERAPAHHADHHRRGHFRDDMFVVDWAPGAAHHAVLPMDLDVESLIESAEAPNH